MLRITLCCLALAPQASGAWAATHRVPSEYVTIQAGIDACLSGDTVLVAAGTYSGAGNFELKFNGMQCTLFGESGPTLTIIDCKGAGKGLNLSSDGASTAEVIGFTIRGAAYVSYPGGAVAANDDDLTFVDVHFIDNLSTFGGGINIASGRLVARNCRFERNQAQWDGGALRATLGAVVQVQDCQFLDNAAGAAGGAIAGGGADSIAIQDCLVQGNLAGAVGAGGMSAGTHCLIERTDFVENSSNWDGGALLLSGSDATTIIRECKFIRNQAIGRDGGVAAMGLVGNSPGSPVFERCLFFDNEASGGGGAIACRYFSAPTIRNCTFAGNSANTGSGGALALYWYSEPIIENTIIALSERGGGIKAIEWSAPHLSCSDVWGNVGGDFLVMADPTGTDGNISADPRFCGAQPDDFTLQANSPCAPANNSCGVLMGLYDMDCDSVGVESQSWGGIKSKY